jgi:hypothetical protein
MLAVDDRPRPAMIDVARASLSKTSYDCFADLDHRTLPLHNWLRIDVNGHVFANCGEASLLNFVNLMCFDDQTQTIDLDALERIGASKCVIDFYRAHSKPST